MLKLLNYKFLFLILIVLISVVISCGVNEEPKYPKEHGKRAQVKHSLLMGKEEGSKKKVDAEQSSVRSDFDGVVRLIPGPMCNGIGIGKCLLTARHCIEDDPRTHVVDRFENRVKISDLSSPKYAPIPTSIAKILPKGFIPVGSDVAILKLEGRVPRAYDKRILAKASLPSLQVTSLVASLKKLTRKNVVPDEDQTEFSNLLHKYKLGTEAWFAGFRNKDAVWRTGRLYVLGDRQKYFERESPLDYGTLLARTVDFGVDPGRGDSGGPLFVKEATSGNLLLHGVAVSAYVITEDMGYASTVSLRKWILDTLLELQCE